MSRRAASWIGALTALLLCGQVAADPISPPAGSPLRNDEALARARTREGILLERSETARTRARGQALVAYRLLRRRQASFLADPRSRAGNARGLDAALWVLAREAGEASVYRAELQRSVEDREALERDPRAQAPAQGGIALAGLVWPARGTLVSAPGLRRDDASRALLRQEGIRILSRLNEPVLAPAAGRVHRVAALPQGGFALAVASAEGGVTILSGLREVEVAEGMSVDRGQRIGLVGRGLDGAPVLSLEFWRRGTPLDPRPLFRADGTGARKLGE